MDIPYCNESAPLPRDMNEEKDKQYKHPLGRRRRGAGLARGLVTFSTLNAQSDNSMELGKRGKYCL